ncbi:hypothetical protein R1flu_008507 [Riccia fluitans]|uniref:Uncharacterized protein n=1 Tax=Riccia fluitans TaxID=41844 RepID=A0ABD1YF09_9MARC
MYVEEVPTPSNKDANTRRAKRALNRRLIREQLLEQIQRQQEAAKEQRRRRLWEKKSDTGTPNSSKQSKDALPGAFPWLPFPASTNNPYPVLFDSASEGRRKQDEDDEKENEGTLPFEKLTLWPSSNSSSSSDHSDPNVVISLAANPMPRAQVALELVVRHTLEITSFVELLKRQGREDLIRELLPLGSPAQQLQNPQPQGIVGVSLFKQRSQITSSSNSPKKSGEETRSNKSSFEVPPKQPNSQANSRIMSYTPPSGLGGPTAPPPPAFAPPLTRQIYSKFKGEDSDSDGEGESADSFIKQFEAILRANKEISIQIAFEYFQAC